MALITKKVQGGVPERLRRFVAENLEALEPNLSVLETSLRLGQSTVDVVAVDGKQTLVLVAVAEVADAAMLISTLDAFIWCLAFPDNVRRLYPDVTIAATRPPRVVFVATRMPAAFLDLVERLSVINPECHELAAVPDDDQGTPIVDTTVADATPAAQPTDEPVEPPRALAETSARLSAGFDAAVARPWESVRVESPIDLDLPGSTSAGPNGRSAATNGHAASGKTGNGQVHGAETLLAQAIRAAEATPVEHAAVNLGVRPRPETPTAPAGSASAIAPGAPASQSAAPGATAEPKVAGSRVAAEAKPAPSRPAPEETRTVNHPALQALRFPKTGVSRQWQEFLDQLAANQ
jgi:hypothetical protein